MSESERQSVPTASCASADDAATIRGVLLDLNGTLLDDASTAGVPAAVCASLAASTGIDSAALLAANAAAWQALWPAAHDDWTLGVLPDAELSAAVWRRSLRSIGVDAEPLVLAAVAEQADRVVSSVALFPEVPAVLGDLRRHGVRLAIVTNGSSTTQRRSIGALGLERLVDAVIVSGELGLAKPDARIFARALDALGVAAAEAIHVGDSPTSDVAGAIAAGVRSVLVDRSSADGGEGAAAAHGGAPEPWRRIADLRELPGLL